MTRRLRPGLYVTAVVLLGVVLCVSAAPVVADSDENEEYVVVQDDQRIPVTPIVDENRTVEEFYDYRTPYTHDGQFTYSSHGTVEYQEHDTSILILYDGPEGLSLVMVHDKLDNTDEATAGGSATFDITDLPPAGEWAVVDDDYPGTDDEFSFGETWSEMNWVWQTGRTDGAAYRGLDGDFAVRIEPAFNEDSNLRIDHPAYDGDITDWQVVSASDDGFERVSLDSLSEPVTVKRSADASDVLEPNASLSVNDSMPEVGTETVTVDASGSTATDGIDEYRWDFTGDGDVDRTTDESITEYTFDDVGEREVSVTVVSTTGGSDTASETVTVVDETAPTARIDAPGEATAGETIELSGAASTDNHRIDGYEWRFGDGVGETGQTVEHSYDEAGDFTVELTVIDASGNENSTTTAIEVVDSAEPTAVISAPSSVTENETVTFDGSDSTGDIVAYEWTLGDGTSANGTTVDHAYENAGEYEIELTVTDENGSTSSEMSNIIVESLPDDADEEESDSDESDADDGDENGDDDSETENGDDANGGDGDDGSEAENGDDTNGGDGDESDGSDEADDEDSDESGSDDRDSSRGSGSASSSPSRPASPPPAPSTPEPPTTHEADVEPGDGTVVISADSVESGDTIVADVSLGDQLRLEEIEFTASEDADEFVVQLSLRDYDSVPGRFVTPEAIELNATDGSAFESVIYQFSVDAEQLARAHVDASNVTGFVADDDDWVSTDTVVDADGDRVEATVTTENDDIVAVGGDGPVAFVDDVTTGSGSGSPTAGVPFELEAPVQNTGSASGTLPVVFVVDGEVVANESVALAAGETTNVTANTTVESPGNVTARVGTAERTLSVVEATPDVSLVDVTVEPLRLEAGETTTVVGTLTNDGTATGEYEATFRIGDDTTQVERVTVAPGENATVQFDQRFDSAGTYDISINEIREQVTVDATESEESTATGTSDADGAGFGAAIALVGLLLAVASAVRSRGRPRNDNAE